MRRGQTRPGEAKAISNVTKSPLYIAMINRSADLDVLKHMQR